MPTTLSESSTRSQLSRNQGRPTLIVLDSHIGYGSPHKQDTSAAHGEPLGEEEFGWPSAAYGWPEDAKFLVPEGVYEHFAQASARAAPQARKEWNELFDGKSKRISRPRPEIEQMQTPRTPRRMGSQSAGFPADPKGIAGRDASGKGAERAGAEHPVVSRRLGRSRARRTRPCSPLPARATSSPKLRAARTCTSAFASTPWRRRERTVALEDCAVRRDIFYLQRLRAAGHPALRPDGNAFHFHLHPRCHG